MWNRKSILIKESHFLFTISYQIARTISMQNLEGKTFDTLRKVIGTSDRNDRSECTKLTTEQTQKMFHQAKFRKLHSLLLFQIQRFYDNEKDNLKSSLALEVKLLIDFV